MLTCCLSCGCVVLYVGVACVLLVCVDVFCGELRCVDVFLFGVVVHVAVCADAC